MYKFLVLAAALACANAGLAPVSYAAPAYAASYAAPAYASYAAPAAYAAPAYAAYGHAALAPAAAVTQQSNILRSYGNLGQVSTYSKTIDTPYSSVSKSDVRVSNPGIASVSYKAPLAYAAAPAYASYAAPAAYAAAPAYAAHAAYAAPAAYSAHAAYAAPVAARAGLLGVAYSAAPAVAHLSYDSPLIHYGF